MIVKLMDDRVNYNGDMYNIDGVTWDKFMLNPVVFLDGNRDEVVGKVNHIFKDENALMASIEFDPEYHKVLQSFVFNEIGFGGIANEVQENGDTRRIEKFEIMETLLPPSERGDQGMSEIEYKNMSLTQKMDYIRGLVAEAEAIREAQEKGMERLRAIQKEIDGLEDKELT